MSERNKFEKIKKVFSYNEHILICKFENIKVDIFQ